MLHWHGVHDRPSADAKAGRCSAAGALVHTGAAATEAPVRAAAAAVPLRACPHRKIGAAARSYLTHTRVCGRELLQSNCFAG